MFILIENKVGQCDLYAASTEGEGGEMWIVSYLLISLCLRFIGKQITIVVQTGNIFFRDIDLITELYLNTR